MKSKVTRKEDNFAVNHNENNEIVGGNNDGKGGKKPVKDDLMIRLAMGQKTSVDKKEMKKLTSKNY